MKYLTQDLGVPESRILLHEAKGSIRPGVDYVANIKEHSRDYYCNCRFAELQSCVDRICLASGEMGWVPRFPGWRMRSQR